MERAFDVAGEAFGFFLLIFLMIDGLLWLFS
jgi:hypothetical protein